MKQKSFTKQKQPFFGWIPIGREKMNFHFKKASFISKVMLLLLLTMLSFNSLIAQNDTMILAKFKTEILPNLVGDSSNFTSNSTLNTLFDEYEVSYFIPYYPANTQNAELRHYFAIIFEGNTTDFIGDLEGLNLTTDVDVIPPSEMLCSTPVFIDDYLIKNNYVNKDALVLANAQCAWTITTGNPDLRVAIADSEFDDDHEDLKDNIREVYGPVSGGSSHGTEVLGVAGATPNSIGVIGAGYNLKWDGSRAWHSGISGQPGPAILAAYDKGARVINISWDGTGLSSNTIQDMVDNGTVIVVAAGNDNLINYHNNIGNIPGVIVVSGVDKDGYHEGTYRYIERYGIYDHHAHNSLVDLCAVSINVTTTFPNNQYGGAWGTSSAAPQVSATAGLILSLNECFTPAQVEYIIKSTTNPIPDEYLFSGLVGTGYLDMYQAVKFAAGRSGTLSGNETWESMEIIGGKLIIPNGITLTIKSEVLCYKDAMIYVDPGGKLIVDGGHLTSICENWGGIYVSGNKHLNQYSASNQGYVELKNEAIIENANEGIFLVGLFSNNSINYGASGGFVKANNTTFKNNKRDVAFFSYNNTHPSNSDTVRNLSDFIDCKFITTDESKWSTPLKGCHITMWDVSGVRFEACTFEDQRTETSDLNFIKQYGRVGIGTIDASYFVFSKCVGTVVPCNSIPTKFINLKRGIESRGSGKRFNISIMNSEFITHEGIYLNGVHNVSVRGNTFTIAHDIIAPGKTDYPFGLYLDRCQMFNTEGNNFNGVAGTASVAAGGAAGLVIRNSGPNNNEFYRSNFSNLKIASQALSANRENNLEKGLRFRCNDYEENYNDLDIRNDPSLPWGTSGQVGMAELQGVTLGGTSKLPDNEFGNISSILNYNIENRGNWMNYFYNGFANQTNRNYPFLVTHSDLTLIPPMFKVERLPNNLPRDCPDRLNFWGVDIGPVKAHLWDVRPMMVVKAQDWDIVTDGGNTQNMKQTIIMANSSNIGTVFGDLISASPYLSNEVLAVLAEQEDPFTHEMILNIMLANPHSSRSKWVQINLDNRITLLPLNYRDSINELIQVYTQRDTLGAELAELSEDYDLNLSEIIYSYLSDSIYTIDSISPYLKHPTNPTYHYQLAEIYFENGNYEAYESTTDSIPLKFELNELQETYHTAFTGLYSQLHSWIGDSLNLYEKDSTRLDWLLNYANTHTVYPSKVHALLAVNDTFIVQPNVIIDFEEEEPMIPDYTASIQQIIEENAKSDILLFPNPANSEISLKWRQGFKPAEVKVYDMNGRMIHNQSWNENNQLTINVSNWNSGIYFINVNTGTSESISRKLIINR
jgi:subtilisin family serine protease